MSQSPEKGKINILFEGKKKCLERAQKDPNISFNAYTFDTPIPGSKEPSDIDVHVFIPELSRLCEKADAAGALPVPNHWRGNNGIRKAYQQSSPSSNTPHSLNFCFNQITDHAKKQRLKQNLRDFYNTWHGGWETKLKNDSFPSMKKTRDINFSVHILPSQWLDEHSNLISGQDHFNNDVTLKRRFIIPIVRYF